MCLTLAVEIDLMMGCDGYLQLNVSYLYFNINQSCDLVDLMLLLR
jgi:hypothetical protein